MTSSRQGTVVRFGTIGAGALFTAIAVISFVNSASSPTDENVFADPPAPMSVMITSPFSGTLLSTTKGFRTGGNADDAVAFPAGVLIHRVNSRPVATPAEVLALCSAVPPDSFLVLDGFFPAKGIFARMKVRGTVFADSTLLALNHYVIVTQITPHGASDRAGMVVGDLILKINDSAFTTALEADRILQSGEGGKALVYEIQRGRDRLTVPVVLAAFGFQLAQLFVSLAGLFSMSVGTFLVAKRPEVRGARAIGWCLLHWGFVAAVLFSRRDPNLTPFVIIRSGALAWSWIVGTILMARSFMLFPVEMPGLLRRRWIPILAGSGALASGALAFRLGNGPFLVSYLLFMVILMVVLLVLSRQENTPERRRLGSVMRWAALSLPILAATIFFLSAISSFMWSWAAVFEGVGLLVMTHAVVYTIGRYRLYGLDLRVRRNIRYSISSAIWVCALGTLLLWGIIALPGMAVRLPAILVHGATIEILDPETHPAGSEWSTRFALLGTGILGFVVFARIRKAGQSWIDRRYYRTHLDYRQAAQSLGRLLATTQTLSDLGTGLGENLAQLMQVSRAGVFFVRADHVAGCERASGVTMEEWRSFCTNVEQLLPDIVRGTTEPVRVSSLPASMRDGFSQAGFAILVPVRSSTRLLGVLALGEKRSESPYSDEDFSFLATAARQTAVAMENAYLYEELAEQERMKHELTIARRIQLASLPQRTPVVAGLDIAGESVPAMEVGGDFFDYLVGPDDRLLVVIGDVSGKGTSAALYMAKVQGILRSLHGFHLSPREMFLRANLLLDNDLEKSSFVTALGVEFEPHARRMSVARAGHLPLYHFRRQEGRVDRIVPRGLGLAISDGATFAGEMEERTVTYGKDDLILLATDGITEARNAAGEEFGDHVFDEILRGAGMTGASEVRSEILARVRRFAGDVHQHDDQTLVVIRAV
jgi:serine phosphatase RsbU (regulator of sigma subunit)